MSVRLSTFPLLLALLLMTGSASAQGGGAGPQGGAREAMWPAPTAEDWAKPCLIQWQRTYEDAVTVSRETGKAILVCVNMDGEIASEHYAGIRYRQPEIAALYEPYVTVIASVYRHNPRDYDEQGRRIPCKRFGTVTCGEHIAIEPLIYEKFLDGRRVAPRHIGVELDGQEMYDVFYAFDLVSVFNAIEEGIAGRPEPVPTVMRGDRSIVDRVSSRDSVDRAAVEAAYLAGDFTVRRNLLQAALASEEVPLDLLRLVLHEADPQLSSMARSGLARVASESSIDLILEVLQKPMDSAEREALIGALARLGETSARARTLATVHRGLTSGESLVDGEDWAKALEAAQTEYGASRADRTEVEALLDRHADATATSPKDAATLLDYADAALALAVDPEMRQTIGADPKTSSRYARLMFEDVRRSAFQAERLGASGWRVNALISLSDYYLGDVEQAYVRAEAAARGIPAGEPSWNSMAVLALFVEARRTKILDAVRNEKTWPAQWLTDAQGAYAALANHPLADDSVAVKHHDMLKRIGAAGYAKQVLDEGIARFPDSWDLHDRLRRRILDEKGVDDLGGLEAVYAAMLREENAAPSMRWFAGYASLVAAEFHRRTGSDDDALGAYGRAIAHYEGSIETYPISKKSADHYIALALAGRARIALERGDYARALDELLASFERSPQSAASLDGLNLSAVATAQMLLARLRAAENEELAGRLQSALDGLDPELLRLPEFEREGPTGTTRDGRPPRRGRRR